MSTDPSTLENDANLSALGRELLDTGGSKPSGPWMPPTAEELHKLLPEYEIVKMLGRGGMGAVYMGKQISLDRPVAIKILSNALEEADASFAERFKNEAKAMGKLSHPGIVAVHDFGETEGGLLYIVMEYVEGTDVARMIAKEGRLHTDHAMAITAHVCDALGYAHERGIIHRDIKPANIMVGYDGVVKVADFGLAKMTQSANTGLTQSGMAMGTLHYMAPEALMLGSAVDHRADIYAVGVMLYQMLAGKLPQGMFELPSMLVAGLDPRYDAIIAKALREDREQRYQSIGEMRRDLDGILTQPVVKVEAEATQAPAALPTQERPQRPDGKPPQRPSQRTTPQRAAKSSSAGWLWAVAGVVVIGAGGYVFFGRSGDRSKDEQLASSGTTAQTPALVAVTPSDTKGVGASSADSGTATKDTSYVNSLGMKFVSVPGTKVLFCIHETRYKDYAAYASKVAGVDASWKNQTLDGFTLTERPADHPVVNVSWDDAKKFCQWLSTKEGKTYRLPTDEEWTVAVGLGDAETRPSGSTPASLSQKEATQFPWGKTFPLNTSEPAGNYSDQSRRAAAPLGNAQYIAGYDDGFPTTAPVMSFAANPFGLYDMGGNVWEWCEDWYDAKRGARVMRGGCWRNSERVDLLSSNRSLCAVGRRHVLHGFRVVLEATAVVVPTAPASLPVPAKPRIDGLVADGEWQNLLELLSSRAAKSVGKWKVTPARISSERPSFAAVHVVPFEAHLPSIVRIRYSSKVSKSIHLYIPTPTGTTAFGIRTLTGKMWLGTGLGEGVPELVDEIPFTVDDGLEHVLEMMILQDSFRALRDGEQIYARDVPSWEALNMDCPVIDKPGVGFRVHQGVVDILSFELHLLEDRQSGAGAADMSELHSRIANYQKARHTQLSDLTAKYRTALTTARAEATQSGVLADVTALDDAIARATALTDELEKNLSSLEVKPLSAMPDLSPTVPQRLKDLRAIFDRETAKIETTLVTSLDQSLATVQTSLTQAANQAAAKAVEDYRKQMMAAFIPRRAPSAPPHDWIDVLSAINPDEHFSERIRDYPGDNRWVREGPELIYPEATTRGEILLPRTENHPQFELELELTREIGTAGFDIKVPMTGGATVLSFHNNGTIQYKGKRSAINTGAYAIPTGKRITVRFAVTFEDIVVSVDGVPVAQWKGDYRSELGVLDDWQSPLMGLWINGSGGQYRFHRIRIRPIP